MRELTLDKLPKKVLAKLDMERVFIVSRCVIAAERFQVFRALHKRALSAVAVGRRTGIDRKYGESFLDYLVLIGLLRKKGKLYSNTVLADKHFVKERSIDWTRMWSGECAEDFTAMSVLDEVIASGKAWQRLLKTARKPDYQRIREDRQWARDFTYALYDIYKPDAEALATKLDLSRYKAVLDVGGGSGVISIALARKNPHITACILELEYVADAAREIIQKNRLSRQISALAGDMYKALPSGYDVIMFWNVGDSKPHVVKKAYAALPEGGLIVFSCSPASRKNTPSLERFPFEYLGVRPKGQSRASIISSLKDAGFKGIKYRRINQRFGMITGRK